MFKKFTYTRKKTAKYHIYREIFAACILVPNVLVAGDVDQKTTTNVSSCLDSNISENPLPFVSEESIGMREIQTAIKEAIELAFATEEVAESTIDEKVFYSPKRKQNFFLPLGMFIDTSALVEKIPEVQEIALPPQEEISLVALEEEPLNKKSIGFSWWHSEPEVEPEIEVEEEPTKRKSWLDCLCSPWSCKEPLTEEECWILKGEDTFFLDFRYLIGKGIGFNRGYFTEEGMFFVLRPAYFWPFADVRFHQFINGEAAGNIGIGARHFNECRHFVLGGNIYYDFRTNFHHEKFYSQIGIGAEYISKCFDLFINAYFPLDRTRLLRDCLFNNYIGNFFFIEHHMESALIGFDLQLGFPFCYDLCNYGYAYIGPYFFSRPCKSSWGFETGVEMTFWNYLFAQFNLSYDALFKTRVNGQIGLTYPARRCRQGLMTQRVYRHEIIALDQFSRWTSNF